MEILYIFILVLVMKFSAIILNKTFDNLRKLEIKFLDTAYANDNIFFLKNHKSVIEDQNGFDRFLKELGLRPNTSKCEIDVTSGPKGVNVALCGMQCINLKKQRVKIQGIQETQGIVVK